MENKKEKKLRYLIFILIVLILCAVPFVCMFFAPTTETTENRRLAAFPSFTEEGKPNADFLQDLGAYFEDHFAFRNLIAAADGRLQSLFGVSSVDTVVKGTDGWLYYTASANDFQGLDAMTENEAAFAARNLKLMQDYLDAKKIDFVFTVAPNKNALYGENMPYYYLRTDLKNSMDVFAPYLAAEKISYADLFSVFRAQEKVLYLKRDSHWNNEGALLAYETIMDTLEKPYDAFLTAPVLREKTERGDLGKMVYSVWADPEWNSYYTLPQAYTFTSESSDVEAALLTTENKEAKGKLLMFRDSFGNTLLPFFAENFASAVFSKAAPYPLERFVEQYRPDVVIAEKVERNLSDLLVKPAIISAPECDLALKGMQTAGEGQEAADPPVFEESFDDPTYICVKGRIPDATAETMVYAKLGDHTYEAYRVVNASGEAEYLLYFKKTDLEQAEGALAVILKNGATLSQLCSAPITLPEAETE